MNRIEHDDILKAMLPGLVEGLSVSRLPKEKTYRDCLKRDQGMFQLTQAVCTANRLAQTLHPTAAFAFEDSPTGAADAEFDINTYGRVVVTQEGPLRK